MSASLLSFTGVTDFFTAIRNDMFGDVYRYSVTVIWSCDCVVNSNEIAGAYKRACGNNGTWFDGFTFATVCDPVQLDILVIGLVLASIAIMHYYIIVKLKM